MSELRIRQKNTFDYNLRCFLSPALKCLSGTDDLSVQGVDPGVRFGSGQQWITNNILNIHSPHKSSGEHGNGTFRATKSCQK